MTPKSALKRLAFALLAGSTSGLCTKSYNNYNWVSDGAVAGGHVGQTITHYGCYRSRHMGMWVEITDAKQDELQVKAYTGNRNLGTVKFGGGSHKKFIKFNGIDPSEVSEIKVQIRCKDGERPDIWSKPRCRGKLIKYTIGDCESCPPGSLREHGTCSASSVPSDTQCLSRCPPGQYWNGFQCSMCAAGTYQSSSNQYFCNQCPLGYFGAKEGETRPTCSGKCPAGTYGAAEGLSQCTKCPNHEVASGSPRDGLTSEEQCGEFRTAGFWQRAGTGSVVGDNVVTFSFSRGVGREDSVEISNELSQEVGSAMIDGTSFETSSSNGWSVNAGVEIKGFSAGAEYHEENGQSFEEFSSYEVSQAVTNSLSTAVSSSITEFTEKGCEQTCANLPGNTSPTVYGWRWVHLIYDEKNEEVVMSVHTCETFCLYHPDDVPLCPPGRCANADCTKCFSGSFKDSTVDSIASSGPISSTPAPLPQPSKRPNLRPTPSPAAQPTRQPTPRGPYGAFLIRADGPSNLCWSVPKIGTDQKIILEECNPNRKRQRFVRIEYPGDNSRWMYRLESRPDLFVVGVDLDASSSGSQGKLYLQELQFGIEGPIATNARTELLWAVESKEESGKYYFGIGEYRNSCFVPAGRPNDVENCLFITTQLSSPLNEYVKVLPRTWERIEGSDFNPVERWVYMNV